MYHKLFSSTQQLYTILQTTILSSLTLKRLTFTLNIFELSFTQVSLQERGGKRWEELLFILLLLAGWRNPVEDGHNAVEMNIVQHFLISLTFPNSLILPGKQVIILNKFCYRIKINQLHVTPPPKKKKIKNLVKEWVKERDFSQRKYSTAPVGRQPVHSPLCRHGLLQLLLLLLLFILLQ